MKIKKILSKEYLDSFDQRAVKRVVTNLFDENSHKEELLKRSNYQSRNFIVREEQNQKLKTDYISNDVIKKEKLMNDIKTFNLKMKKVRQTFTEDEKLIFKHSIIERLTDRQVSEIMFKSEKVVKRAKKSCYVKIALEFGLLDIPESIINIRY